MRMPGTECSKAMEWGSTEKVTTEVIPGPAHRDNAEKPNRNTAPRQ